MARRDDDESPTSTDFEALAAGLSPQDLQVVTHALMSSLGQIEVEPAPSRLRAPLDTPLTYRVRVDLEGVSPPIWRRLELASDLRLDVVHEVLQVAIGWTDSHLHQFRSGDGLEDHRAERYLNEFDISEGDTGTAEVDVRLDQLLQEVGDRLFYAYDFGDGWDHTIKLEAVLPRAADAPSATCTAGRRSCPPEDVGGIWGYAETLEALAKPDLEDQEQVECLIWLGPDFDPERFDLEEVNALLPQVTGRRLLADLPADLPGPVTALLAKTREPGGRLLVDLVGRAQLDEPAEVGSEHVDAETAARMVSPYTWMLNRVGSRGITLTQAGYLPPAVVQEAADLLDLDAEWIGTMNRESQTYPVLEFRESARQLGLVRKLRGRLLLTTRGRALADDPVGLWHHIAARLPLGTDDCEQQAGLICLLFVAAGESSKDEAVEQVLVTVLSSIGWIGADGRPLDRWMARSAADPTSAVLLRLGLWRKGLREAPSSTSPGCAFARAALRSWDHAC